MPDASERAVAEATLDAMPWPREELVYARVDLVRDDAGAPLLLELELAEPSLFLGYGGDAPARLAAAIAARIDDDDGARLDGQCSAGAASCDHRVGCLRVRRLDVLHGRTTFRRPVA